MSKKFNIVINTLIILLIIALVMVMMNYYTETDIIPTFIYSSGDLSEIPSDDLQDEIQKITPNEVINSGDKIIIISGDDVSGETIESIPSSGNEFLENPQSKGNEVIGNTSPLIMTSENEISSKEKREILAELDKTLMDLLEVVDRVQIVDEDRLINKDSEVQE